MSSPSASAPLGMTQKVVLALASVYVIWSSTYYAIRVVVRELPPFLLGGSRYLLAGALLLAFSRLRGLPLPTLRQWRNSALIGALLFGVGNGFVAVASIELGSGIVAIVCATMPLAGALLSPLFGLRPSRREAAAILLGLVAVTMLAAGRDLTASPLAVGLLFLAPIGWALGSLLVRRLDVGPPLLASSSQMIMGGAVMLVVSGSLGEVAPASLSLNASLMLVHLVVLGSLVAFLGYQYLLVHARPALAMSYAYVNPVLAVVLGASVGGESVSMLGLFALVLISGAVFLTVTKPTPTVATPPSDTLAPATDSQR